MIEGNTKISEERKYWDLASKVPDVDREFISSIGDEECARALGTMVDPVLEIGCGVGRMLHDGWYGCDISQGMLDIAKERKPNCHYKKCNGRKLPYEDNFFQSVYSMQVFQHIPPKAVQGYIAEAYRVLKPGGTFRFQFVHGSYDGDFDHNYLIAAVKKWTKDAGFEIKEVNNGLAHELWTWITGVKPL